MSDNQETAIPISTAIPVLSSSSNHLPNVPHASSIKSSASRTSPATVNNTFEEETGIPAGIATELGQPSHSTLGINHHRFINLELKQRQKIYCWAACPCSVGLLLFVILFPLSFRNIKYNEVAFLKNQITGIVAREKVYNPGRHFIGPAASFVIFPSSHQTVTFTAMSVWTKAERQSLETSGAAGTAAQLDLTFQYRLRPNELSALYSSVALQYEPFITNLATEAIKNISTRFTAEEWVKNRRTIQDEFQRGVDVALEAAHADCELLQLNKIEFPVSFVDRMLAAAVQLQTNQAEESRQQAEIIRSKTALAVKMIENDARIVNNTAQSMANLVLVQGLQRVQLELNDAEGFKQTAALIRSQTDKEAADINNEAKKVLANADAEAQKIRAFAQNEATQLVDQARAEGLKIVGDALGMSTQKELVSLDYIFKLVESKAALDTYVGLPPDLRTVATAGGRRSDETFFFNELLQKFCVDDTAKVVELFDLIKKLDAKLS